MGYIELSSEFPSGFVDFSLNDFQMHGFVTQRLGD